MTLLGEVLTPRYSEELRGVGDTDHTFSPEFEKRMRRLIRQTDHPAYRFRGAIAAAACLAVAVGSAVLVPVLSQQKVTTETTGSQQTETTYSTQTDALPGDVSENEENATKDYDAGDTTPAETTAGAATGARLSTLPPQSDETDEMEEAPIKDGEDEVVADTEKLPVEQTTAATNSPETTPAQTTAATKAPETTAAQTTAAGNAQETTAAASAQEPWSTGGVPSSDDVVIKDDETEDIVVDEGETDVDASPQGNITDTTSKTLGEFIASNFGGISFENLWAGRARLNLPGVDNYIDLTKAEQPVIQEFVHGLGAAEVVSDSGDFDPGETTMAINIQDFEPETTSDSYAINFSSWQKYGYYFNGEQAADDEDRAIPGRGSVITFSIQVGRNGIVRLQQIWYGSRSGNRTEYIIDSPQCFEIGEQAAEKLFDSFSELALDEMPGTVGDMKKLLNVSVGNIAQAEMGISGIYDCLIVSAKMSTDYVGEVFEKYADRKLTFLGSRLPDHNGVWTQVWLNNGAELSLVIHVHDDIGYISYGGNYWSFGTDPGEGETALDAAERANGFTVPRYGTLGEYLDGKNLNTLESVSFRGEKNGVRGTFKVTDAETLSELLGLIKGGSSAPYDKTRLVTYGGSSGQIQLKVNGWKDVRFTVEDNDVICLRLGVDGNMFVMPEGFYERFRELAEKNAEFVPFEPVPDQVQDDEDDGYGDSIITYEDELTNDDKNPDTSG